VLFRSLPGGPRRQVRKAKDHRAPPHVPPSISVGIFVDPLIAVLLGELPVQELTDALPNLPAWAAGQAQLCIGFKQLEAGALDKARDAFRAYHELPADDSQRWAFNLQP